MAKIDSIFSKGFKAAKCKTLLKLTIPRIKLLRNRRDIQIKQMRREIAKLLETGQEATARIRVEHIIREEKTMAAQEIVELFCELIAVRLPIIEAQRECPLDLKEAISSMCFAAPRCADLPELLQVQMLFAGKYGKEFASAATELRPECGVNRQLVELLSIRAPAPDVKLKLLKEIAEEHELNWDPSASETELLKPHEDLLNGPTRFVSGSKAPLPKEKHDEKKSTTPEPTAHEHTDSDEEFDIIDLPDVPKQTLQPNEATVSAPGMQPFTASALSKFDDRKEPIPSGGNENLPHLKQEVLLREKSVTNEDASLKSSHGLMEDKQFVPFICSPSQSYVSFSENGQNSTPSLSQTRNRIDLQDVLTAAQAAAETAERAAAAARSAASIAQLRISELVKKRNDEAVGSTVENPFHLDKPKSELEGRAKLDSQNSFGDSGSPLNSLDENNISRNHMADPSYDDAKRQFDSSLQSNNVLSHGILHQPQRLLSMHDETYFSYPNLFTSQGSNLSSHAESFTDAKQ